MSLKNATIKPVVNPVVKPVVNPVVKPVVKPVVNPVVKPVVNPVVNPVVKPVVKPVVNPVVKPVVNPVVKPVVNPVVNPVVKPVVNPVVKPVVNPVVKPVVKPVVNPVVNPPLPPVVNPPLPPVVTNSVVHVLLIEADNMRNLGSSCLRDVVNIDYYVNEFSKQTNIARGQTVVLSIDNDNKIQSKFTTKTNIIFDKLNNYKTVFETFTNNVKQNDYAIILVSGHGYQMKSKTGEETDNLDEYIAYNGGIILDNELNTLLVSKLSKTKRTFCLGDTCHSGTLFDINNTVPNVYSLSACLDNQLDSCDIGYNAGFGGALTVQLLDITDPIKTLLLGKNDEINALVSKLSTKLILLNQKPLLSGI
jgi:hypothetical protein